MARGRRGLATSPPHDAPVEVATGPPEPRSAVGWTRVVAVVVVLATLAVPVVMRAVARVGDPSDGALTAPNSPAWTEAGVMLARVEGAGSGLREGDIVTAVDGVALERWAGGDHPRSRDWPQPGDRLTYTVERAGQTVDVEVVVRDYSLWEAIAGNPPSVPLVLVIMAIAGFVFVMRPRDHAARVLLGVSALIAFGAGAASYVQVADLLRPRGLAPFLAERIVVAVMWGAICHFLLVFPSRWLSPRAHRRAVAAAYIGPFALYGLYLLALLPAAEGDLARLGRLVSVSYTASRVFPVALALVVVLSFRRARSGVHRARMRWVAVTFVACTFVYMAAGQVPSVVVGRPFIPERWLAMVYLPFPIVVGGAILRYRLFDVEVALKRSLIYTVLTVGIFGVYFLVLLTASRQVTGPVATSALVASGLVAVFVSLVRDALGRRVTRLVYGARDDPYEVVSRLGERLEATGAADEVLPAVAETLAHALRLPYVAIELDSTEGVVGASARYGQPIGQPTVLVLEHRGERVGRLALAVGPGTEPFGPADRRLLDEVCRTVAVNAHVVVLRARLQRTLEDVVTAREEERRALHRDLHDGLCPTLVGGAMTLAAASARVAADPERAADDIDRVGDMLRGAVADVRRLVDGLRPATLDELGLEGAIRRQAAAFTVPAGPGQGAACTVSVAVDGDLGQLSAAAEVAAFHIVMEALSNACRHGRASRCHVTLAVAAEAGLDLGVADDGCGLPAVYAPGVGLASMRRRAAELGGTFTIERLPEGGTAVQARVPLGPPIPPAPPAPAPATAP
ncbi:MAG: histidine kinase, partial [Actinomycetota bacterium]